MRTLEIVLLLLAVCAALRLLAERIAVPYMTILVVGGLGLAFIPGLPRIGLPPDLLFVIFVPPLLYAGALSFPLSDFRRELGAIARLAVLLVLVSIAAVALITRSLNPSFTWAAAITLGAIVAPPDAVAALSAVRSLRLPRIVQTVLEGEGLANDAVALLAYRMAVVAVVSGSFSPVQASVHFVFSAAGGVAIGLVVGVVAVRAQRYAGPIPVVANVVSLLTPFAAYLPAEQLGASGILAVVSAGMYVARAWPRVLGSEARLQAMATQTLVVFVLESLVFILVGLELPHIIGALQRGTMSFILLETVAVSLCLVLIRLAWVLPSAYVFRRFGRWLRHGHEPLPPLRQVMFVGWAGLRGGESLILALALPLLTNSGARFPARDEIVFITFGVIFMSLVLQGPTLAPLARRIGVGREREDESAEAHARLAAAEAGLNALAAPALANSPHPEVVRYLRLRQRRRARHWAAHEEDFFGAAAERSDSHAHATSAPSRQDELLDEQRSAEYRRIRFVMIKAEQQALLDLRDSGVLADDVMRRIQQDLDLESVLLEAREPVVEPAGEITTARVVEGRK